MNAPIKLEWGQFDQAMGTSIVFERLLCLQTVKVVESE